MRSAREVSVDSQSNQAPAAHYGVNVAPKFLKAKTYGGKMNASRDGSEGRRYATFYEPCKYNPFSTSKLADQSNIVHQSEISLKERTHDPILDITKMGSSLPNRSRFGSTFKQSP